MNEQELDRYLEKNLKIEWIFDERECEWFLGLKLKGRTISKIHFEASSLWNIQLT